MSNQTNNITTSEITVKQWLKNGEKVWCRPVHPGISDSEADQWQPADKYEDGWEFLCKNDHVQMTAIPEDAFTSTEYKSLVDIMAFFDWDKFKKLETLGYNNGDKDLDLGTVKEYIIDSFRELVTRAQQDGDEYKWSEGCHSLRFEYRKDIGLHLMYVPLQEGDD